MKDGKPETTADCLRELARVMDMASAAKIDWQRCLRILGAPYTNPHIPEFTNPHNWTFARAIVEGNPVFVGDELYGRNGDKFKVEYLRHFNGRTPLATKPLEEGIGVTVYFADQLTWERKPLCMVEGKPVYEGCELYCIQDGVKFSAHKSPHKDYAMKLLPLVEYKTAGSADSWLTNPDFEGVPVVSWNPPKPKTVMFNGDELPMPKSAGGGAFFAAVHCFTVQDAIQWENAINRAINQNKEA